MDAISRNVAKSRGATQWTSAQYLSLFVFYNTAWVSVRVTAVINHDFHGPHAIVILRHSSCLIFLTKIRSLFETLIISYSKESCAPSGRTEGHSFNATPMSLNILLICTWQIYAPLSKPNIISHTDRDRSQDWDLTVILMRGGRFQSVIKVWAARIISTHSNKRPEYPGKQKAQTYQTPPSTTIITVRCYIIQGLLHGIASQNSVFNGVSWMHNELSRYAKTILTPTYDHHHHHHWFTIPTFSMHISYIASQGFITF